MVAAAFFAVLSLFSVFFYAYFTYGLGSITTASFWLGLMVPVALAAVCAGIAIMEERRKRTGDE